MPSFPLFLVWFFVIFFFSFSRFTYPPPFSFSSSFQLMIRLYIGCEFVFSQARISILFLFLFSPSSFSPFSFTDFCVTPKTVTILPSLRILFLRRFPTGLSLFLLFFFFLLSVPFSLPQVKTFLRTYAVCTMIRPPE